MTLYSERFMRVVGAANVKYTVPAGYRAIITCISIANLSSAPCDARVKIGTFYLLWSLVPGDSPTALRDLRVPVYAGEVIEGFFLTGTGGNMSVSGYLLKESGARVQGELEVTNGRTGEPLPVSETLQ